MARVFSAVEIEDEDVTNNLVHLREKLDLGFNHVGRQKLHVTMQFFREADSKEIEQIKEAMDQIRLEGFKADIKGVGTFPSKEYIRVVWAGVEDGRFQELYRQASDHSVEDDQDHEFDPHITLLRVKNLSPDRKKKLQRMMLEFENYRFGTLNVKRVKLFESELKPSGSIYKQLHVKEL